jgi:hypothetical protein
MKPSEHEILRHISQHGPKLGYGLGKEAGYSQKTGYEAAKSLTKKGFLSVKIVGKTRAGADKKEYSLTVSGIPHAIVAIEKMPTKTMLRKISGHWADLLPLVFGKWHHFREQDVEDIAKGNLILACHNLIGQYSPYIEALHSWEKRRRKRKQPLVTESTDPDTGAFIIQVHSPQEARPQKPLYSELTTLFYYHQLALHNEKWTNACKNDPDIKAYLIELTENYLRASIDRKAKLEQNLHLLSRQSQKS